MTLTRLFFLTLTLITFSCFGQEEPSEKAEQKTTFEFPEPAITQHTIELNGKRISYTATAGHLLMRNEKGEEIANMFYVAYEKNDITNPTERPITFSFNGGPGSSSVWLHMGALGPKRVLMTEQGLSTPPPFDVVDNAYSWLEFTDLVFIDPMETGFSRPAGEAEKKMFTGYSKDLKSVGDFIQRYITRNNRWNSPKYIAGESYGTTRAAGLSGYLQDRHGMYLNGLILISAALNFQTFVNSSGNDLPYPLFLPSFAATAYYHEKVDRQEFPELKSFLEEVEEFALGEYSLALMQGDNLSTSEVDELSEKLSGYTGLKSEFIRNNHLRISTSLFTKELLRDQGITVGRFDGTITGVDYKKGGDTFDYDPSYSRSVLGAFTMAINDHLGRDLNYDNDDMVYEILTGNVYPWEYDRAQNRFLDNSNTLRDAIHKNPHLRVLICNGLYDLATPYFATEYTINHMYVNPALRNNLSMKYYNGGHMMYTLEPELKAFTEDVRNFVKGITD